LHNDIPFDELIVLVLTDPGYEALAGQLLTQPVCGKSVLGEAEVEKRSDVDAWASKLFLLLYEVGTAYKSNGDLVTKF
jgi:hypothetical protein